MYPIQCGCGTLITVVRAGFLCMADISERTLDFNKPAEKQVSVMYIPALEIRGRGEDVLSVEGR